MKKRPKLRVGAVLLTLSPAERERLRSLGRLWGGVSYTETVRRLLADALAREAGRELPARDRSGEQ